MIRLGFHVSISGSFDRAVDRALELSCDTFQVFISNPRSWYSRELSKEEILAFKNKRIHSGMEPVFGHMPYILNLASPDEIIYCRSVASLRRGIERCLTLRIPMLVTHIGSHLGAGSESGIARVVGALNSVLEKDNPGVVVLLENGSGSRNKVGSSFKELGMILGGVVNPDDVGICFDTCHAFAAGYDMKTRGGVAGTLEEFDSLIGLDHIGLVHLNDTTGGLGTGVDRHEHIGLGGIGIEGFRAMLEGHLASLPMVMETPIDDRRGNKENMAVVRGLATS